MRNYSRKFRKNYRGAGLFSSTPEEKRDNAKLELDKAQKKYDDAVELVKQTPTNTTEQSSTGSFFKNPFASSTAPSSETSTGSFFKNPFASSTAPAAGAAAGGGRRRSRTHSRRRKR